MKSKKTAPPFMPLLKMHCDVWLKVMCLDNRAISVISGLLLVFIMQPVKAETKWAFGLGVGHLNTPAYIGSSDTFTLTMPVPYIKLETDWFDLSEGSLKMRWFEQTPFRLSFNFDLGLPVESDEVAVRQGMDDLAPVLQVGPMLSYHLQSGRLWRWQLELPVTYAFSIDASDVRHIGWVVTPRVAMLFRINDIMSPLDLEISAGPVYGAKDYHQYYYSVLPSAISPTRHSYEAEGGYAGYRVNVSFTQRTRDIWFGLYLRYHDLSSAKFVDSPLVDQDDYWLVTFAASWIFASSH